MVGTGALVNTAEFRSISMMSACRVMAQKSWYSGSETREIGASRRSWRAASCQATGSAYAAGSAKIRPRFSGAMVWDMVSLSFRGQIFGGSSRSSPRGHEQAATGIAAPCRHYGHFGSVGHLALAALTPP